MRKPILLAFILSLSILSISVFAQDCTFAVPRYGVVECYDLGSQETINMPAYTHYGEYSTNHTDPIVVVNTSVI